MIGSGVHAWLYGAILVGSLFLALSLFPIVRAEWRAMNGLVRPRMTGLSFVWRQRERFRAYRENSYFGLTFGLILQSLALAGVGVQRLNDFRHGLPIEGSWPIPMALFLAILCIAKTIFHWAATVHRTRRIMWRGFLLIEVLWLLAALLVF